MAKPSGWLNPSAHWSNVASQAGWPSSGSLVLSPSPSPLCPRTSASARHNRGWNPSSEMERPAAVAMVAADGDGDRAAAAAARDGRRRADGDRVQAWPEQRRRDGTESVAAVDGGGGCGRSPSVGGGWRRRMGTKPELRRRRMWTEPERCPFAVVVLCRRRPSASVGVGGPAQQRDGARSADAAPLPAPPLRRRRRSTRPPPAGSPPLWRARQDPRRGRRSWRERRRRAAPRRTRRRRGR